MRITPLISAAIIFLFAPLIDTRSQSPAADRSEPKILAYRIRPIPKRDRTDLEIQVSFKTEAGQTSNIKLPTDNFGTPDIHNYVTGIEGVSGTVISAGNSDVERIVTPDASGSVSIRYVLSYDPKVMEGYAYGPNTGADFFHLAGCQWLLHIGEDDLLRLFQVEFVDVPPNWQLYSSMSLNAAKFETQSSYDDWISAPIGGGENSRLFHTGHGSVAVFVHGTYAISRDRIYSSIEKIIRVQRAWFGESSQGRFTVVVAPRPWVVSGYAPDNSFVCFLKPDITEAQLKRIVAHELFHTWLPNKIAIEQEKGFAGFRFEWFSEGFTDYFARKIMTRSGMMTNDEFVQSINGDLKSIADNPYRSSTYEELNALAKAGKFGPAAKKLSYFRGALIALSWDSALRKRTKSTDLDTFIRKLYLLAAKSDGKLSEATFYDFGAKFGIDARGDVDRYIMRGESIVPPADAFGRPFRLLETRVPSFDIGFMLDEAYKTHKISGVVNGGAAFQAGLRNDMDFVSAENSARFSNAWNPANPLVVNVKIDGKPRRIEYFPNGEPIGVPSFISVNAK